MFTQELIYRGFVMSAGGNWRGMRSGKGSACIVRSENQLQKRRDKPDMKVTLILSLMLMGALFLLIWAAVALVQSKKLFGSAPKDIQEAVLKHEERFPGARILGWIILVVCVLAFPAAFIYAGWDGIQNGYSYWKFAARFLTMLYLMKAFDIIFLDWFLLTKSHFYQHYYPETEGCAGYRQFGFNRKEQLLWIILFPFIALLLAWICTFF